MVAHVGHRVHAYSVLFGEALEDPVDFAFVVGTFGVVIGQIWVMWLGVGILILGGVVGKVMGMMGMGQYPRGKQEAAS